MRIGLDVDGVLADNHTAWIDRYNARYGFKFTPDDLTQWTIWKDLGCDKEDIMSLWTPDIYEYILPYSGAQAAVRALVEAGHDIEYVTGCMSEGEYLAKIAWLGRWGFPHPNQVTAVGAAFYHKDKTTVAVDWLVDDHVEHAEHFPRYSLLVTRPHNRRLLCSRKRIKSITELPLLAGLAAEPVAQADGDAWEGMRGLKFEMELQHEQLGHNPHSSGVRDYEGKVDGGGYKASMDNPTKLPLWLVPQDFMQYCMWGPRVSGPTDLIATMTQWVNGGDNILLRLAAEELVLEKGSGVAAIRGVAKVLQHGAKKYAANNWRRGMKYSEVASAALRHLLAVKEGEECDQDSGLPHLDHFGCNLAFLLEYTAYPNLYSNFDDLFKRPKAA